jgi:hypothetical protein
MSHSLLRVLLLVTCVALNLLVATESVLGQEDRAIRIARLAKASTVLSKRTKEPEAVSLLQKSMLQRTTMSLTKPTKSQSIWLVIRNH